jgi:glycine oxidase
MYPAFLQQLQAASGIEVEASIKAPAEGDWRKPGILYVSTNTNDPAPAAFAEQRTQGHHVEDTAFNGHCAFWLPDEGQVENRHLTSTLRVAAEAAGVTIYENTAVELASDASERQRITLRTPHDADCEQVLLCAGAWSGELLNNAASERDTAEGDASEQVPAVRPLAGQMLAVRAERLFDHIIYSSGCYLVPRRDGRLLIGATMEDHGFHKYVTLGATQLLLQRACDLVPELAKLPLESQWVGLRPVSGDGLPLLGRTRYSNLFIASGHGRNGILLTPVTAALMADTILDGAEIPADFSPERFSPTLCASN